MTALALNISGLYLGTGVAAALGGIVLSLWGVTYIPLVAGLLLLAALGLASMPAAKPPPPTP
jgi:predicted MFS family arabinose efflux permease